MRRKLRGLLYRWINWINVIPFWVHWLYPYVHFCPEMDGLLILDDIGNCFCDYVPEGEKVVQRGLLGTRVDWIQKEKLF